MALVRTNPVQLSFKAWLALEETARRANYIAYRDYYDGDHPTQLTDRQKKYLEIKGDTTFCANYCSVVVDALAERLTVTGFTCENKGAQEVIATWWLENRMDEVQNAVHLAAVRDGDTFVMVDWDEDGGIPAFIHHLANDGSAGVQIVYDDDGKTVLFATKRWLTIVGEGAGKERRLNMYFPDRVEKYVSHDDSEAGDWRPYREEGEAWPLPWVDATGQPLGVPVVHFRNRPAGQTHGLSELANVIPLQDALNKALIDYIAAMDTTAFQLIFVSGFEPAILTIAPGSLLWSENENAKATALPASDMAGLHGALADIVVQIAGVSRTPQYYFQGMGDPPSGESLKAQETGLVSKAKKRQVSFGNSWEDVMHLGAKLAETFGRQRVEPGHVSAEWKDPETRNELIHLQTLESKSKLGVPEEKLWSEMGYDDEDISKMQAMKAEAQKKRETLGSMLLEKFERAGKPEEGEGEQ